MDILYLPPQMFLSSSLHRISRCVFFNFRIRFRSFFLSLRSSLIVATSIGRLHHSIGCYLSQRSPDSEYKSSADKSSKLFFFLIEFEKLDMWTIIQIYKLFGKTIMDRTIEDQTNTACDRCTHKFYFRFWKTKIKTLKSKIYLLKSPYLN